MQRAVEILNRYGFTPARAQLIFWTVLLLFFIRGVYKNVHAGFLHLQGEYEQKMAHPGFELNYFEELSSLRRRVSCAQAGEADPKVVHLYSKVKPDQFLFYASFQPLDEQAVARYAFSPCRVLLHREAVPGGTSGLVIVHSTHPDFATLKGRAEIQTENFLVPGSAKQ